MLRKITPPLTLMLLLLLFACTTKIDGGKEPVRDETIRVGQLENGLTYYVKDNSGYRVKTDPKTICFSLVIKAGSVDEEDSQRGLAHFTEHLSFEGTSSFRIDSTSFFNGTTLLGRPHKEFRVQAHTTFNETVYRITLPILDEHLIDTTLLLLKEWLYEPCVADSAIAKQREIILREWFRAEDYIEEAGQWYATFFNDTRLGHRLPIGDLEVIRQASKSELARYRNTWYRPDLAAVVVVGHLDGARCVEKIVELFSETPAHKISCPKEEIVVPDNKRRNILITGAKSPWTSKMSITCRHPHPPQHDRAWMRHFATARLAMSMLNHRLKEVCEAHPEWVMDLETQMGTMIAPHWTFETTGTVTRGCEREAISLVAKELERAAQQGFLPEEFDQARLDVLKHYTPLLKMKQRSNTDWRTEMEADFLVGRPAQTPRTLGEHYQEVIDGLTVKEVNRYFRSQWRELNSSVWLSVPEVDLATAPSKEEIHQLMDEARTAKHTPYRFDEIPMLLYLEVDTLYRDTDFGVGGSIVKTEDLPTEKVSKYTLSNGATVVFRRDTAVHYDYILLEAISRGGKRALTDEEASFADLACKVYNDGPVGGYPSKLFRRLIANTATWEYQIGIADEIEFLKGRVSTPYFEQYLKHIHQLFYGLDLSSEAHQKAFFNARQRAVTTQEQPMMQYGHLVADIRNGHGGLRRATAEELAQVELSQLEAILRTRFASPSDFTFYLVGGVHTVDLAPLLEKYLGGGEWVAREEWLTQSDRLVGEHTVLLEAGDGARAEVVYMVGADMPLGVHEEQLLQAAARLLNQRIFHHVREELHLVYHISVGFNLKTSPTTRASFEIAFQCEPEDISRICEAINRTFAELIAEGPTSAELSVVRRQLLEQETFRTLENDLRKMINLDLNYPDAYAKQAKIENFIKKITADQVKHTLKQLYHSPRVGKTTIALTSKK